MRQRLQFVGGPRDGEWVTLHEVSPVLYLVVVNPGLVHVLYGSAVPSIPDLLVHRYEPAEWKLDEGSAQYCLRYAGVKP